VSECDREASTIRRLWPTRGCPAVKKKYIFKITVSKGEATLQATDMHYESAESEIEI
jgi:hypothetical protein